MKVPNIETTVGVKPVTIVPNEILVEAYLSAPESEDADLVRLLAMAVAPAKAGETLRLCLEKGRNLVAVYPGMNEEPPKNGTLLGAIPDGSLYLV